MEMDDFNRWGFSILEYKRTRRGHFSTFQSRHFNRPESNTPMDTY